MADKKARFVVFCQTDLDRMSPELQRVIVKMADRAFKKASEEILAKTPKKKGKQ